MALVDFERFINLGVDAAFLVSVQDGWVAEDLWDVEI